MRYLQNLIYVQLIMRLFFSRFLHLLINVTLIYVGIVMKLFVEMTAFLCLLKSVLWR
jgi:hypothetical protein